jgi:hypothetical protein
LKGVFTHLPGTTALGFYYINAKYNNSFSCFLSPLLAFACIIGTIVRFDLRCTVVAEHNGRIAAFVVSLQTLWRRSQVLFRLHLELSVLAAALICKGLTESETTYVAPIWNMELISLILFPLTLSS